MKDFMQSSRTEQQVTTQYWNKELTTVPTTVCNVSLSMNSFSLKAEMFHLAYRTAL